MIPHKREDRWTPSPELFAAYADGELDGDGPSGALRQQLEAWLAEHPEAVAEIEAQRQITQWCQTTTAADPGETAWTALAAQLQALPLPSPAPGRRWSRLAWLAALGGTAAAVLWLILAQFWPLGRPEVARQERRPTPGQEKPAPGAPRADVFEVATAAEVEILSVQGDDTGTLVVGALPVQGALVLLQPGEVTLTSVAPARDNMVPELREGPSAPMIWAPLDVEREDPEEPNQG